MFTLQQTKAKPRKMRKTENSQGKPRSNWVKPRQTENSHGKPRLNQE